MAIADRRGISLDDLGDHARHRLRPDHPDSEDPMTLHRSRRTVAMTGLVAFAVLATACSPASVAEAPQPSPSAPARRPSPAATPTATPVRHAEPTATAAPTRRPRREPTPCPVVAGDRATRPPTGSSTSSVDDRERGPAHVRLRDRTRSRARADPPTGELSVAEPPFTFGPSGLPDRPWMGEHVLQVVFRQMSLVVRHRRTRLHRARRRSRRTCPRSSTRSSTTSPRAWSAGTSATTGRVAYRSPRTTRPSRCTFAHAS